MSKVRVHVALRLSEWEKSIVESGLRNLADVVFPKGDVFEDIEKAEVAIAFRIPKEVALKAEKLRFIQVPAAGADGIDLELFARQGVIVASSKGCNARAVAEHAFALLLALAKRVVEQDAEMKKGGWRSHTEENFLYDIEGSTLAIIGYGEIGREVAKLGRAFGMRVLAVKKTPVNDPYTDLVVGPSETLSILAQADFVVVALPLTQETVGFIGERELRAMKKTSFLINVARGHVVNEEALYKALTEGWISGAGIDVWWRYPPEEGWPSKLGIHKLPNVIATTHKAGWTRRARESCLRFAVENVARFIRGEKPLNVINPEKGY
ncbi:MAG: 2-hydroxyacid dehydrogenase [Infirmifilum sp.]